MPGKWTRSAASVALLLIVSIVAQSDTRGQEMPRPPFLHYVTWSPNEDRLVTSSTTKYGSLSLRDQTVENLPAMEEIYDVVYSPDGRYLAVAQGRILTILDSRTNLLDSEVVAHDTAIITISWSPDGNRLATSSYSPGDQEIKIWNAEPLETILTLDLGSMWQLTWNPISDKLAIANIYSPGVFILDVERSIESQREEVVYIGRESSVSPRGAPVAWSNTGTTVAVALDDRTIALFDVASGEEVVTLVSGHTEGMSALAFSPDGALLASASNDGMVHAYDVVTHALVASYEKGARAVPRRIAFSPFGGRLAFGSTVQPEHLGPGELFVEELNTRVVAPVVSVERLREVAAACTAKQPVPSLESLNIDAMTTDMLPEFISSLRALRDDSIHPSCRGDLLAIAEGLMQ